MNRDFPSGTGAGVGLISISQITIAGYALAQFALAYACIAQIGLYMDRGYGQVVRNVSEFLAGF